LFDFNQEFLDVRDMIARVEQLEVLRQPGPVDTGDPEDAEYAQDDLFAELATLESALAEMAGCGGDHEWRGVWYPVTLIRESDFEDYARELAEDIGAISRDAQWPLSFIDWEAAANALRIDYSDIEIDGTTYVYR
jgi:antirestriction protein